MFAPQIQALKSLAHVEEVAEYAFRITPQGQSPSTRSRWTISSAIHGDEVIGAYAIQSWLKEILEKKALPTYTFSLILGNPRAFEQNKRFTERDLNRCFLRQDQEDCSYEVLRAKEIEPILRETDYFLDLHQTIGPTIRPFFVFPYTPDNVIMAHALDPDTAIVTRWGQSFSSEGLCSDEFVLKHGGRAVTLECGQKGYDASQEALAHRTIQSFVEYTHSSRSTLPSHHDALFKLHVTIPCPPSGFVELNANLQNFTSVTVGEILGRVHNQSVVAPISGCVLFPKHRVMDYPEGKRPTELLRFILPISIADLPLAF